MMRFMLMAVKGGLCYLDVPEVMRCALRSTLYAGGCGGRALFIWRCWTDAVCATP